MRWLAHIALVVTMLMGTVPLQQAHAQSSPTVREVVIDGNQRIETGTIRSYLLIQEGDRFDSRRIDQSLKSLFATGLFADVSINRQADALLVKVVENPLINRIAFEGNKRLEDDFLKSEITLKPRVVFTRSKVQNDVKRILDVYKVNGRFGAKVEPMVIQLNQNRADLVFEIEEGPLTNVSSIRFIGNKEFDDDDLRDVIRTSEKVWYNFLTSNDTYDADRLTFDRELLRRFYLSEGYADFRVDSANAELTPDRSSFFITFNITEGKQYTFAKPNIDIGVRDLKLSQLSPFLEFERGDVYDNRLVEKSVQEINNEIGNRGFPFVEVRPKIKRDEAKREIAVSIEVRDGPRVFVERIDIVGNVRTVDAVIRREFKLVEGDAFNAAKMRRSRQRINNLNFFNKVNMTRELGSTPDKTILKVQVE
ncbi:MAG: outer membrane protein assembly factor BamA, partial [Rhodospirillales bacterium]|nr:outer membrane protein assembly factor BamA [Rhodospirillales bacterium]